MSVRDKIVLLSALIVIVGGALIINGRFNAELVNNDNSNDLSSKESLAFPRQLSIKDIDTLNDARGAVEIIKEKTQKITEAPFQLKTTKQSMETKPAIEKRIIRKEAFAAVRATAEVQTPTKVQTSAITGPTYTVQKGQTLTDIAISVYNTKSNAIKNARKIYEFNKDILPSMDKIKVGQKLRIPPDAVDDQSKLRMLADSMQDKVQFMSSKYVPAPKGKLYVVKKGDSLWTIAQNSLGNGSRYKEIIEINKGLLGKGNNISPGMAIIIPN